jgi:hypothetical protein
MRYIKVSNVQFADKLEQIWAVSDDFLPIYHKIPNFSWHFSMILP